MGECGQRGRIMIWHKDLYVGSRIAPRVGDIRAGMERGEYPMDVWVIVPAANGKDIFDIRPACDLRKSFFLERSVMIIGLAGSRKEAIHLIQKMADDQLRENGFVNLRSLIQ